MGKIQIRDRAKEEFCLIFPYGELIIFFLIFITWAKRLSSRQFLLTIGIAWLAGKMLEMLFPSFDVWHWHFARLMAMLAVECWALRHTVGWGVPLIITSLFLSLETLFQVNEPGVLPYGNWPFSLALILVAWLTAKSYWRTLTVFTGSVLLNQAVVRFSYEGIVRYANLPDSFIWNFGVSFFAFWAGLRMIWQIYSARMLRRSLLSIQKPKKEH